MGDLQRPIAFGRQFRHRRVLGNEAVFLFLRPLDDTPRAAAGRVESGKGLQRGTRCTRAHLHRSDGLGRSGKLDGQHSRLGSLAH